MFLQFYLYPSYCLALPDFRDVFRLLSLSFCRFWIINALALFNSNNNKMKAISLSWLAATGLAQDFSPWNPNTVKAKGTTTDGKTVANWVEYTLSDT